MKYTENLKLKKPEAADYYQVEDFNENMDSIDSCLKNRGVNNNLLINSNFAHPVNQRGETNYPTDTYTTYAIDRWKMEGAGLRVTVADGYVKVKSTVTGQRSFSQFIEFPEIYSNKVITASLKYRVISKEGTVGLAIMSSDNKSKSVTLISDGGWHIAEIMKTIETSNASYLKIMLWGTAAFEVDVEWVKAELGNKATPYVPRMYLEEWQMCQRYFQKLYVSDAKLLFLDPSYLLFTKEYPVVMRTTPTVSWQNFSALINNMENPEFLCKNESNSEHHIIINTGPGKPHGYTLEQPISIRGEFLLDAEL